MAFYYKIEKSVLPLNGIQAYETKVRDLNDQPKTYDFSKHVLIELLDDVTPEMKLWEELGLASDKSILHKRMMVDSHRVHCRRAVVVCANASDAKSLVQRVSQTKIMRRCVCAAVVQDLLFDFKLFEKQILWLGDKRSQHQLLYVTDLNRCREPALLAQYLRDLFSPFGTVLSVFVSEDGDGFAHPEGVVKFAHLSEAFAAELAYDQFIVGMERLSVTTHHNILLSQCDLRARLREVQRRYSVTLNKTLSPSNNLYTVPEVDSPESSSMESGLHSVQNIKQNLLKRPAEYDLDISKSPRAFSDLNISHSTELDDVLNNPCKSNLIDCLKSMFESSATRETIADDLSLSNQTAFDKAQSSKSSRTSFNTTQPSTVTLPLEEHDWSSRISNWIANIPKDDFSQSNNINNTIASFSNTIPLSKNAVNSKSTDCASSLCSFITCDSGSRNNIDNPLSSPSSVKTHDSGSLSDSNETIMRVTSSPESFHTTVGNLVSMSMCTSDMSLTRVHSQCSVSNSISQKVNNSYSHKLSLKSQRLNSSLFSNSQQSSNLSGKNKSQPELALRSTCTYKSDSPLRAWLKNDLLLASNVNVFENSRKIVCAIADKNVIAHVGCSNMTCDICYPGSTNLLFGCH